MTSHPNSSPSRQHASAVPVHFHGSYSSDDTADSNSSESSDTNVHKKMNHLSLPSHPFRIFLILLGFVHCMLSSGMIFGWASLELVLRHEGIYANLCDEGNVTMAAQIKTGGEASTIVATTTSAKHVLGLAEKEPQWYSGFSALGTYSEQRMFSNMLDSFSWRQGKDTQENYHEEIAASYAEYPGNGLRRNSVREASEPHLRQSSPAVSCHARSFMFEQIFTAGAVAVNLAQLFSGFFLDTFGPKITCATSSVLLIAGLLLFGFSNDTSFQAFIPGYILIGIGGPPIQLAVLHLSNLYPSWKAMIKSVVSGLFGLSSLIFFLFFLVHEYLEVSRTWIFVGYCGVIVLIMISGLIFWPTKSFLLDEVILLEMEKKIEKASLDSLYVDEIDFQERSVNSPSLKIGREEKVTTEEKRVIPFSPLVKRSFLRQLLSLEMIFMVAFMCLNVLRLNYFAGTMDTQLYEKSENNREGAELAAKIFSLIASCGFVGIPLIGVLLDKAGLFVSYMLVASTNFLYNLLFLVPLSATWFESIIFVLYSVSRPFIYASKYAYVSDVFGFANFGKLVGICNFSIGIFTTLQFLINYIVKEFLNGTHFWVNVSFAAVGVAGYIFPAFILIKTLQYRRWRRRQAKAQDTERAPLLIGA